MAQQAVPLQRNKRNRLEVSILGLAEMGRSGAAPLPGKESRTLVFTGEAVVHTYADVSAEGWKADGVLVLLVEEVRGACVQRNAATDVVAAGDVKARITGIAGEAEAEEITIGSPAGKISRQPEPPLRENGIG